MTCFDFEHRLQEALDLRRIVLPDELSAHAADCLACQKLLKHFQRLQDAVAVWRSQSLSVNLADVVLNRLSATDQTATKDFPIAKLNPASKDEFWNPKTRRSAVTELGALISSALALLIAAGIGWQVSENVLFAKRQTVSKTQIAAATSNPLPSNSTSISTTDRQLDVLLHDARDAYAALASEAWLQVSSADVLLPPTNTSNPFSGDDSMNGVSESLSQPLAPLSIELRDAVDSWIQQVFSSQDSST